MKRMLALIAIASIAAAEDWQPPKNTNAALGYWTAFSLMKDVEFKAETCNDVLQGKTAWNEEALGELVDQNQAAIEEMRRASRLPDCCFGLDYEEGSSMRIPHLMKARALGNLNVLCAKRDAAQGRTRAAIDGLFAGVRFGEQLHRDGTLICAMMSLSVLDVHLQALIALVAEGKLGAGDLAVVAAGARAIAPYGFDWGEVIASEKSCWAYEWQEALTSDDPVRLLAGLFHDEKATREELASGKASAEAVKEFTDRWHMDPRDLSDPEKVKAYVLDNGKEFGALADELAAAMRLPASEARERVAAVEAEVPKKGMIVQYCMPAMVRTNQARFESEVERAGLIALTALAAYRAKNGKDAESLDGLDVPVDPFSGKPFELAATADGVEVRSAGKDRQRPPQQIVYRLRK